MSDASCSKCIDCGRYIKQGKRHCRGCASARSSQMMF